MSSLGDEGISFADLALIIEKDTVLAGSVLRLVNSAFYARRGTVNSVKHAVSVLGIGKLRNLSMSMSLARMWAGPGLPQGWSSRHFNLRGVTTAILADQIAVEKNADYAEGAFSAGLLQNVGLVLIAIALPEDYASVVAMYQSGSDCLPDYERAQMDLTHAELSGEVLERWHLPPPIAKAVLHHHGPHEGSAALSRIVDLADQIAGQMGILAQPWLRAPEGQPEQILAQAGLENRAASILEAFHGEFETLKSFFG